jgi:flagellar biosynthesis/type III secretory pathway protein FliH
MSAVIKSGDASAHSLVRPVLFAHAGPQKVRSEEDEERERVQRRLAALESEIRQRDSEIAGLRGEIDAAYARGKSQGHMEGLAAAERRESERLALLENASRHASAIFESTLESLERLATLLARDVLEMILGDSDHRRDAVAKIMRAEVAKIEKSALVEIAVSAEDFPDKRALSAALKRTGIPPGVAVVALDLPGGSCEMKLRLGRQDVGINQQWGVLRERLTELSLPEAPP